MLPSSVPTRSLPRRSSAIGPGEGTVAIRRTMPDGSISETLPVENSVT